MNRLASAMGLLLLLFWLTPACSAEVSQGSSGCCPTQCCCPPRIPGCADDYCRKPLPCVPCVRPCGTCDDYCRKPLPCVPCLSACGCDDYCRKPLPCFGWPLTEGLRCVPTCPPTRDCALAPCQARVEAVRPATVTK